MTLNPDKSIANEGDPVPPVTVDVFERGSGILAALQRLGARGTVEPLTSRHDLACSVITPTSQGGQTTSIRADARTHPSAPTGMIRPRSRNLQRLSLSLVSP